MFRINSRRIHRTFDRDMGNLHARRPCIYFLLIALLSFFSLPSVTVCYLQPQTYIIQLEKPIQSMEEEESLKLWHKSLLRESDGNTNRLLHHYSNVFNGFAAELTEEELEKLSEKKGFVCAFPNRVLSTATTYTPKLLGLQLGRGLWKASNLGKGIIIGVLDTGVTPGHPSFDDWGMPQPPPPTKWKGSCRLESGCNNKLIGAVSMTNGTIVDLNGHGTHTSSTAAGNFVHNASSYGMAGGTAAGIAPRAHIAMYQVCTADGRCLLSDILAGMDSAVKDGVDVISMSLSLSGSLPLDKDALAISAFHATEKGILISCSAGNSGPDESSLSNDAPWVLTVAATTTDRSLRATVKLGNGEVLLGESLDQSSSFTNKPLPLFYNMSDPFCYSLNSSREATGKAVVCFSYYNGRFTSVDTASFAKAAGAAALIYVTDQTTGSTIKDARTGFPTVTITSTFESEISTYLSSFSDAVASIFFNGTIFGVSPAPTVAAFSSRGPSIAAPRIIKPDISGPGVNILAAFPTRDGIKDSRTFNILSGTSMATPHLSGVAALIKSVHPDWSPAAIKSAMMTTSKIIDIDGKPIKDQQQKPASFFDMGAGLVNPSEAVDPGLVYDVGAEEYTGYLCNKFGDIGAKTIIGRSIDCTRVKNISESELNYPSILLVAQQEDSWATVTRTATNVGPAKSNYKLQVQIPMAVTVDVSPRSLDFSEVNEKKSFAVTAKWASKLPLGSDFVAGRLSWVSNTHIVTSPIIVSSVH